MNYELQNAFSSSVGRDAGGIIGKLAVVMKETYVLRPGVVLV
jgi:hypothetical protein